MSVRVYRGGYSKRSNKSFFLKSATISAILSIASQIIYPISNNKLQDFLTFFIVIIFSLTSLLHAIGSHGFKFAGIWIASTYSFALIAESIGVHTAWPFGSYYYSDALGVKLFEVPLIVPLAWCMLSYPLLIISRRLSLQWTPLIFGWGLMAWDLFLDPIMVDAEKWFWNDANRSVLEIPGVTGIPLSNAAGWLLCGVLLGALLNQTLPKDHRKTSSTILSVNLILGWTLFSGIVGSIFFFNRPWNALVGGVSLGVIVLPHLVNSWLNRD